MEKFKKYVHVIGIALLLAMAVGAWSCEKFIIEPRSGHCPPEHEDFPNCKPTTKPIEPSDP